MNLSIFGLPGLVSGLSSTIRAGPAFRFAAARTKLSALSSRPLQAYMDLDRVRRHIRPWQEVIMAIIRTHVHDEPGPRFLFTPPQYHCLLALWAAAEAPPVAAVSAQSSEIEEPDDVSICDSDQDSDEFAGWEMDEEPSDPQAPLDITLTALEKGVWTSVSRFWTKPYTSRTKSVPCSLVSPSSVAGRVAGGPQTVIPSFSPQSSRPLAS